jgi:hypothetical protein
MQRVNRCSDIMKSALSSFVFFSKLAASNRIQLAAGPSGLRDSATASQLRVEHRPSAGSSTIV